MSLDKDKKQAIKDKIAIEKKIRTETKDRIKSFSITIGENEVEVFGKAKSLNDVLAVEESIRTNLPNKRIRNRIQV